MVGAQGILSAREKRIASALAAAAMPAGSFLEGGGEATAEKLDQWLEGSSAPQIRAMKALLYGAEVAAIGKTGRPLSRLARADAEAFLASWGASQRPLWRALLRAILTPLKAAHFDDP